MTLPVVSEIGPLDKGAPVFGAGRDDFESAVAPHLDALYRTALRMARSREEAEDLVQETVLRAYRGRQQFQAGTNFRAWIFTILTNTFINVYRMRSREPKTVDFSEVEPVYEDAARNTHLLSPEDVEKIGEHVGDEVKRALNGLPSDYRIVLHLSVFEGLAYKEIAEVVGVPLGTVMSRLFRARRAMQDALTEYAKAQGIVR